MPYFSRYVLDFNGPAVSHRYEDLALAMGLPAEADLPDAVHKLVERLGLPARLGSMGVDKNAINVAAPIAEKDHTNGTNPRRATAEDYQQLMQAAL